MTGEVRSYVLGLDIGNASIGWAALRLDESGEPCGFLTEPGDSSVPSFGIRIFDSGVENYGQGAKEESRNVARRQARQQRRQTARRARRIKKTFNLLTRIGFLPAMEWTESDDPAVARDRHIKELDAKIAKTIEHEVSRSRAALVHGRLPYILRVRCLGAEALPIDQIGRALYHLSQRRGFRSSRKDAVASGEGARAKELGQVKSQIAEIEKEMAARGHRTLGEYLLALPEGSNLRRRWTSRKMYTDEFDAIWESQSRHHPTIMTDRARRLLRHAIFRQRPLKSVANLIGLCEIEDGSSYLRTDTGEITKTRPRRRCRKCDPLAQRFRLLQHLNDLRYRKIGEDAWTTPTAEQRTALLRFLEVLPSAKYREVKNVLGLSRQYEINLELGGDKSILGIRTDADMLSVFGARWFALPEGIKYGIVDDLWACDENDALAMRIRSRKGPVWSRVDLNDIEIRSLCDVVLESDYASLSRSAIKRLLPHLEQGIAYATAVQREYGKKWVEDVKDHLPPVAKVFGKIRNPVVDRSLSELRHLINAIVREHGKPARIHVELARDLKRSKEDRQELQRENRRRESEREELRADLTSQLGSRDISSGDILRYQLWKECGHVCPYSGRPIGFSALFGGEIDIEHIIPLSRCLDDSPNNKTLCFADVNRNEKRNRTPWEAWHADPEAWADLRRRLDRNVEENGMSRRKMERFLLDAEGVRKLAEDFESAQLNDTRHASAKARSFLGLLYGSENGIDRDGVLRVQVGNGQATAFLRRAYQVSRFLGGSDKNRHDHRHHGIDAVMIALTSRSIMNRLGREAELHVAQRGRSWGSFESPWPHFHEDCRRWVDSVIVSARIRNRARGPLHKDTHYSTSNSSIPNGERPRLGSHGPQAKTRVRLGKLTAKQVDDIVDDRIREIIRTALSESGYTNPADAFGSDDVEKCPMLPTRNGGLVPIRSVRVWVRAKPFSIGRDHRRRLVVNEENHHIAIYRTIGTRGEKWLARIVSGAEAQRRRLTREPVISRSTLNDAEFICAVAKGEYFFVSNERGEEHLLRVDSISATETSFDLEASRHNDARPGPLRVAQKDRIRYRTIDRLRRDGFRPVTVTILGQIRRVGVGRRG